MINCFYAIEAVYHELCTCFYGVKEKQNYLNSRLTYGWLSKLSVVLGGCRHYEPRPYGKLSTLLRGKEQGKELTQLDHAARFAGPEKYKIRFEYLSKSTCNP